MAAFPHIICLMGPTASGKTELAIRLVSALNAEIVSVDSAMVYRGMDVGTAKPSAEELALAPHRLIDIRDPAETYSAADFCTDAVVEINQILSAGKQPLLVGGTMLYYKALQDGLSALPAADAEIRASLAAQALESGWAELHQRLSIIDPIAAARIKANDSQRISRALEVHELTGVSLTEWHAKHPARPPNYRFTNIALMPQDRDALGQRIAERFNEMLKRGFIAEVEGLYCRPELHLGLPAMRSVGYRQVWEYLQGQLTYKEMQERGVIATRQLAKRQMTWLRGMKTNLHVLETASSDLLPQALSITLSK